MRFYFCVYRDVDGFRWLPAFKPQYGWRKRWLENTWQIWRSGVGVSWLGVWCKAVLENE